MTLRIFKGARVRRPLFFVLCALLCAAIFSLYAQSVESAEIPPKEINVLMTPQHQNLFDIPIAVIPIPGCNFEKTEDGVTDKKKKISFEVQDPDISYQRLLEEISDTELKKNNMEVKARSSFIWNGCNAELLKLFQKNGKSTVGKWALIIERGENKCWILTGIYNSQNQKTSQAVLDVIKSACWRDAATSTDEPPSLGLNVEGTPFRLAGIRGKSVIYTKDGLIPTKEADHALFVVSKLTGDYPTFDKRKAFADDHILTIEPKAVPDIISQNEDTIGGRPAIVTVAYTEGENGALIYQAAVFQSSEVAVLVGIARGNSAENLEYFHALAASYGVN